MLAGLEKYEHRHESPVDTSTNMYDSGFRIQEMFIQYYYIANLFTYIAHRLSLLR